MLLIPSGLGRLAGYLSPSRAGDISAARAFRPHPSDAQSYSRDGGRSHLADLRNGKASKDVSLSNKTALAMIFKLAEAAER